MSSSEMEDDMNRNRWIRVTAVFGVLVFGVSTVGRAQSSLNFVVSNLTGEWHFLAMAMAINDAARAAEEQNSQSKAAQAFDKLKTLTGRWEAQMPAGKAQIDYELVAGGSVLVSHDKIPGEPEMLTVYYLDSDHLVLTHYCSAGNQPHMQAEPFDAASSELRFAFVSAGNLAHPTDGHMHRAMFKFNGPDDVTEEWTWYQNGKVGFTEPLTFHRVK
jgi:hypothetical protein